MQDEPYEDHWSESYSEPDEYDEPSTWDVPEEAIVPIRKPQCQLCGFSPLLPPWNEGELVKCPNCGARQMVAGHA